MSPVESVENKTLHVSSLVSSEIVIDDGTIFALPSNDTPPMVLAVANVVAVAAFPLVS